MLQLLDCTLRDGGYINNWRFNDIFKDNYYKICDDILHYIEIGFINKTDKYKKGIVGNNRILTLSQINLISKYKFQPVVMADFSDINLDILKEKINVSLVRIAFHKNDLHEALKTCKEVKDLGYNISVNAMAITNYNMDELEYLFNFINENGLDVLYIADSYGSLHQEDIKEYLTLFDLKLNKNCKIGFHLHNNLNNAYSNYEYLKNISGTFERTIIVDSTMFGMGRGAGNLQTELVIVNENKNIQLKQLINILIFIQDNIKPLYKNDNNEWGYDLDYLLSGYLKMHPNYVVIMRDLQISMKNRFFLIEKIFESKSQYNYFNQEIINKLITKYKNKIL
tara:strand:+ start:7112 stop:8125 length:1014 start_codon:yes stop_codon:yes gene_type:complete